MIRIRVRRQAEGMELSASGHADYAPRGEDIVCAAVSALLFGFLSYLLSHASSAAAGEGGEARTGVHLEQGRTGDCRQDASSPPSARVEYRTREGNLWVRTHGMCGVDTAAWAVTRAGLSLVADEYPACVCLAETT